jgi:hypothetical protein
VSAYANSWTLSTVHQDCCVPTNCCANTALNIFVSWKIWFILWGNSVDVISCAKVRKAYLLLMRSLEKLEH